MKKLLFLLLFLFALPAKAQDFVQNYSFVNTGTSPTSQNFTNTGVSSFMLAWSPQTSMNTCSVQVDSSADGITWGSGDLIASTSCTTVGSSALATLSAANHFVRVHVTAMSGNGGLNVTLKGWGGGGSVVGSVSVTTAKSGLAGGSVIYPNAPPYNIFFDGRGCYGANATWANASSTINCYSGTLLIASTVVINGSNSVTVTFSGEQFNPAAMGWQNGDTVTFSQFSGGDAFLNTTTFVIASQTATTVTGTYTHATYTNVSTGWIYNTQVGPFATAQGFSRSASVVSGPFANGGIVKIQGTPCNNGTMVCVAATVTAVMPVGTATFVSATQVTTTATSTAPCNTAACQLQWFTDDRLKWYNPASPAGTVDNAIAGAGGCVALYLPAGTTPIPFGFGNTASSFCGSKGTNAGIGEILQTDAGNYAIGQGIGATKFLYPADNNFSNCTGSNSNGSTTVCNFAGFHGGRDFTIFGADYNATGTNAVCLFCPNLQADFWDNISLVGFAAFDSSASNVGFSIPFSNSNDKIYVDRFGGAVACQFAGIQNAILTNSFCGDIRGIPVSMSTNGTVRTMNTYVGATLGTVAVWVGNSGNPTAWSSTSDQNYGACGAGGAQIYIDNATASASLINWYGGNCAYDLEMNGGKVNACNSKFTGTTNGINLLTATSSFINNCPNTVSSITGTGSYINEVLNANSVPVTAAKLVLGAGFGSTAANTALTGANFPIQFTITNSGTGQAASPTIVYTFPSPLLIAPFSCSAIQTGGTNPTLTYTAGTPSLTGVTFTTVGTPTVSDTEIIQITCVTP